MAFFIASSPHTHRRRSTSSMMMWVAICALPGLIAQTYFFGVGTLIQLGLGIAIAILLEAVVMLVRGRSPFSALQDNSTILTAWLLAVAIPPFSPWWVLVIGLFFAIVVAKHLYGGLGQNIFNPAMVGYVVLLISFPVQMTSWTEPTTLSFNQTSFSDAISIIFTEYNLDGYSLAQIRSGIDGITAATPLDTFKTSLHNGLTNSEIMSQPIFANFAGVGWGWVNISYLVGGLILIKLNIIQWRIPAAFIGTLALLSTVAFFLSPGNFPAPSIQLLSGATMIGAFFIATDPVSASTTAKGRLLFGAMIALLVFVIRTWGGYPDGVAFAVLIANMCVPMIDKYTKPKTYGHA